VAAVGFLAFLQPLLVAVALEVEVAPEVLLHPSGSWGDELVPFDLGDVLEALRLVVLG
jgi:hypothetical protein